MNYFVKIRYVYLESIFIVGTTSMTCFLTSVSRVDISFEQNCSTLTRRKMEAVRVNENGQRRRQIISYATNCHISHLAEVCGFRAEVIQYVGSRSRIKRAQCTHVCQRFLGYGNILRVMNVDTNQHQPLTL